MGWGCVGMTQSVNLITNKPKTNDPELCAGRAASFQPGGWGQPFWKAPNFKGSQTFPNTMEEVGKSWRTWKQGNTLQTTIRPSQAHSHTLAWLNTCVCFFQSQDCEKCLYWTLQPFNTRITVIPHWKLHSWISRAQVIKLEQALFFFLLLLLGFLLHSAWMETKLNHQCKEEPWHVTRGCKETRPPGRREEPR